jgi:asparagine synthase (glutamine-hydrolysing)
MCGIAGFAGSGQSATVTAALTAMTGRLAHRGPDGEGVFIDPRWEVALGHRRLVVIDPSGGRQPMEDQEGHIVVVFNGEIYNHHELRQDLQARGYRFRSDHSDTEVLVHGFKEWGEDLPLRLNGMFAFAILDRRDGRLFLARDRFGEKPLYYVHRPGLFAFASEISALLCHPEIRAEPDRAAARKFMAYGFVPAPRTLYAGVHKLPHGHAFLLDLASGGGRVRPYYRFRIETDPPPGNEDQWAEELEARLAKAVKLRLESDVPLGILLSGGLDSSAILSFAGDCRPASGIDTFCMGFREASFDESAYARTMAAHVGSRHHEDLCDLDRARRFVEELGRILDDPINDPSIIPTSLVFEFVRRHVTVALSGDGGDELFAGYDPFAVLDRAHRYHRLVPRPVHRAIEILAGCLPISERNMAFDFKLRRGLRGLSHRPALWSPVWLGPLGPDEVAGLAREPVDPEDLYSEAIALWDGSPHLGMGDRVLEFYTNFYLAEDILVKTDRASMRVSLESRAPFLDVELTDFVRRLPYSAKFRNGRGKHLLRRALSRRLPAAILERPKKGFGIPLVKWLKEFDRLPVPAVPGLLDEHGFARMWDEHRAGRRDHRSGLWSWIVLNQTLAEASKRVPGLRSDIGLQPDQGVPS